MSDAVLKAWHQERVGTRPRLPRFGAAAVGAVLGVALLFALLVAAASVVATDLPDTRVAQPATPPRPSWIEIQKPVRIFDLSAPALDGAALVYTARRLSVGDAREDVLAFGTLAGTGPALRLKLLREAARPGAPAPLFAALAREAADAGLAIGRSGLPDLMGTRFGRFEIADVALAAPGLPAASACSGFRLALGTPALIMTGLACGTAAHPLARGDLACLIDRLDLASAGDDTGLRDFFAATELTRNNACSGMRLGPDGVHAAWLDEKPAPARTRPDGTPATHRKSLRRR